MFACIYRRSVSKLPAEGSAEGSSLIDLAFTFSPLVEQTTADTVVLDISGQDLLFGPSPPFTEGKGREMDAATRLADEIVRRAQKLNLAVQVAIAANPDVTIHAARSFKGTTVIEPGDELARLGMLSIKDLDCSLSKIDAHQAEEIQDTLALWGIRTFDELARLPLAGIAERLGQEGVALQKLAQGKTDRRLNLVRPPIGFEQMLELDHAVAELEPLSFILSRLLNQLCANLIEYALATNELKLRLGLEDKSEQERSLTLPVPVQNSKTLLRLLLFDIEAHPPSAPVIKVTIGAEPVKPRAAQTGLFVPLAPEPEKLEITLARLAKLVGQDKVGSPELLDTHRPDSFRMQRFRVLSAKKKKAANNKSQIANQECVMGFRVFRPPWHAEVQMIQGQPARINAVGTNGSKRLRGRIGCASGPWRASGDWWRADVWARDEWDVAVIESNNQPDEVLCRIYRDLTSDKWFVAGIYD